MGEDGKEVLDGQITKSSASAGGDGAQVERPDIGCHGCLGSVPFCDIWSNMYVEASIFDLQSWRNQLHLTQSRDLHHAKIMINSHKSKRN